MTATKPVPAITYLALRIRPEDREVLEAAARADRTSLSGWVRSAALRQARWLAEHPVLRPEP